MCTVGSVLKGDRPQGVQPSGHTWHRVQPPAAGKVDSPALKDCSNSLSLQSKEEKRDSGRSSGALLGLIHLGTALISC